MPPPISPKPLRELAQRAVYQHFGNLELAQHLPKKVITSVVNAQPVFLPVGLPGQMRNGCMVKVCDALLCYQPARGSISWGTVVGFPCTMGTFISAFVFTAHAYLATQAPAWSTLLVGVPVFGGAVIGGVCVGAHVAGGCLAVNKILHKP